MMQTLLVRALLVGVLAVSTAGLARAQEAPIKFGKIDEADLTDKPFVADSAASAVVLCDFGRSRFEYGPRGFVVVFERIRRVKILKKSGYEYATGQVSLYHANGQEEKLTTLKGFTYNLVNGQVVKEKLNSESIFKEEKTTNITIRKFTMPNVRVGSVVEYAYTIGSDFAFNFQDWTFQEDIPIRWSEYRASIPEYFDYRMLMQGYEPLAVQEQTESTGQFSVSYKGETVGSGFNTTRTEGGSEILMPRQTNHRWAMQNVPPLREEPYMTTANDYVARIDFELAGVRMPGQPYQMVAGSWEKIDSELLTDDEFGTQLNRASFLKDQLTPLLAAAGADPAARIAAVHGLVRRSVKYNGQSRLMATTTVRRAFDQKSGSSADVNLLLIAALREAGFAANPLVLSTRSHGRLQPESPMLNRLNYVMAHVALPDGQEVLLDATDELAPYNMVPTRCLNGQGRLVLPEAQKSRWIDLKPKDRLTSYRQVTMALDENGGLRGSVHQEHAGYLALAQREKLRELGEKKYVAELGASHEGWSIPKYTFKGRDELHKPLMLEYEFVSSSEASAPVGTVYLNPLRDFGMDKNPFLHENRRFPVDLGSQLEETVLVNLTLPAGYELAEMPQGLVMELPEKGGRFTYGVQNGPTGIQIVSRLTLSKPVYSAEEYAYLRAFFARLMAKQGEQLVIKKKV
ncbi:DUF3857 domain-containing protein [Hymenobacter lapidiphilus]|uniref:DUF3857 and transglutaminase domain-containing protein n=1 Tax=Hymenobacter lapidiphilus TaxID=2608003 RepID=A0A7Y7U6G1_9BACT|nr:DUF3857 domain-containing protein [Hymenobacter lapidiphilus]NVO32473.1 DUF3857 and transglutaminase domain-containing protein [Hymenobacter lapidiphilus]